MISLNICIGLLFEDDAVVVDDLLCIEPLSCMSSLIRSIGATIVRANIRFNKTSTLQRQKEEDTISFITNCCD